MQKWEYKVIEAWQGRVRRVDNQEQLKPVPPSEPNSWALSQQADVTYSCQVALVQFP